MEISIIILAFIFLVFYVFNVSRYFFANFRIKDQLDIIKPSKTVAIVIPFRNEATNIKTLIKSLFAQEYPNDLLEIIFVDDHSTDRSSSLIEAFVDLSPFKIQVLSLTKGFGKKAALKKGVEASTSEYVITCDADCTMNSKWVATMASHLNSNKSMIIGPVKIKTGNTLFEVLQETEFCAIMACTSGAAIRNKAISCNGANLGYSRALYEKIKPYDLHVDIASGDDVFFLFKAKQVMNPLRIGFAANTFAVVETSASSKILPFVNQRIRWAKKSKYFEDWDSKKFGMVVIALNMLMLFLMIYSIFNHHFFLVFISCFISKLSVDYVLLLSSMHWNRIKYPLLKSVLLSLIYPFYLLSIALLSLLSSSKWKGRNL